MEKKRISSGELSPEFVVKYGDFLKLRTLYCIGYKLVRLVHGNYYSVATGSQRYKPGIINSISSYDKLYVDTETYREEMVGKVAVFSSMEGLLKTYKGLIDPEKHVILEVEIAGDLHLTDVNNYDVFVGTTIVKMKEIK